MSGRETLLTPSAERPRRGTFSMRHRKVDYDVTRLAPGYWVAFGLMSDANAPAGDGDTTYLVGSGATESLALRDLRERAAYRVSDAGEDPHDFVTDWTLTQA
jgi:hypothetical protein